MKYLFIFENYRNIVSIDDLYQYDIPDEIKKMMSEWEVILKSPHGSSFYSSLDISWGNKPDKSFRVSDHWNFYLRGGYHCQTIGKVQNNTHVSIGQYDSSVNKYRIILSLPSKETIVKTNKLKYLRSPESISIRSKFKEMINNREVHIKIVVYGVEYNGIVRKYTGNELKIENNSGELIFNDNHMDYSKVSSLELTDKNGSKIDNPIF